MNAVVVMLVGGRLMISNIFIGLKIGIRKIQNGNFIGR